MQRLDAAVEHLGKAGVGRYLGGAHAFLLEQPGGAAGGQQLDAGGCELARQLHDA
jgi:hypothetical protein